MGCKSSLENAACRCGFQVSLKEFYQAVSGISPGCARSKASARGLTTWFKRCQSCRSFDGGKHAQFHAHAPIITKRGVKSTSFPMFPDVNSSRSSRHVPGARATIASRIDIHSSDLRTRRNLSIMVLHLFGSKWSSLEPGDPELPI